MSYFNIEIKEDKNLIRISGVPVTRLVKDINKKYNSVRVSKFFYVAFSLFGRGTIAVHKSFLPELVYLLSSFDSIFYNQIIERIMEKTWMSSTVITHPSKVKLSNLSDFNYSLKPYQKEFIELYDDKKQKYNLNGYILAFEQGLGKTFTSIALMHSLQKDAVIVIAPKSTLKTVWKNEVKTVFKEEKDVWVIGDPPKKALYYIVNYESIEKLSLVMKYISQAKRVGIIVDESHNFTNAEAKRVLRLKAIAKATKCNDVLLMSGTPIRALGKEMVPTLEILDPYFDDLARRVFLTAFGVSVPVALDILKNRLGIMMHRKMKTDVLKLPDKFRHEIKIKVPNSDKYTLDTVKKQVKSFVKERNDYYTKNKKTYEADFKEAIDYLKMKLSNDKDFKFYLETLKELERYGYDPRNKDQVFRVAKINKYEKDSLRPMLPPELRKKFDKSKAVIKYVNLKIMGEVLGGLLNQLRADMFSDMVKNSPLCEIISKSEKKTVCFTTFVDVVKLTNDHLISKCKSKPILVFGETSSAITPMLKDFKEDTSINPLVATIQTLSTGVTLIEANTVVFLNKPWRHVEASQAEDRVHRIGQDTNVHIYTFVLDTGGKANLSTRMEDVVTWSKEMFEGIVGTGDEQTFNRAFKNAFVKFFRH